MLKQYYRDPLYRNSIAMMQNSVFAGFFGLLFWIVAAWIMPSKGGRDLKHKAATTKSTKVRLQDHIT
jgi:hypothetical protein